VPPAQPDRARDGNAAITPTTADVAPTRESVLAAFARNRVPPQQAPQPAPQPPPPERQAEPEPIREDAYDEYAAGWMIGDHWGEENPGAAPRKRSMRRL
jgi:hypothetical protein